MTAAPYPWFVRKDLDGFFGLFVDNLVQLLVILDLCTRVCGMTGEAEDFLTRHILPGAAVSILFGNLCYAWQARRVARQTNRSDVCALPYGINTPSLLIFVYFVMAPAFDAAQRSGASPFEAARTAWEAGLVACVGSGLIELLGAFVAQSVRKRTPRAALLSTLAGIAIGFISMSFALQLFQKPLIAMVPLALVLLTYFSQARFPVGLPGGFLAVGAGTAIAWCLTLVQQFWPGAPSWLLVGAMNPSAVAEGWQQVGATLPRFSGDVVWHVLHQPDRWLGALSVIVPMGLFNLVGSLQNIESAEAGGDSYNARTSLLINGIGTIMAALFGSCFPTTIYIGHPGWKAMGARAGYSVLNGLVVTALCLTGSVVVVSRLIPMEAGIAIVLWIGIVITAQAFSVCGLSHAPAVAIGLFPAIAAWGATVVQGAFLSAWQFGTPYEQFHQHGGRTMQDLLTVSGDAAVNSYLLHGLITVERGYIFTCMFLAAISAHLIDRRYRAAAMWALIAALFAGFGLTHAYQLRHNIVDYLFVFSPPATDWLSSRGTPIAVGYALFGLVTLLYSFTRTANQLGEEGNHDHSRQMMQ